MLKHGTFLAQRWEADDESINFSPVLTSTRILLLQAWPQYHD